MTNVNQLVFILDEMLQLILDVTEIEIESNDKLTCTFKRFNNNNKKKILTRQLLKSVQYSNDATRTDKLLATIRSSFPASILLQL